jgi:hypothetical protein
VELTTARLARDFAAGLRLADARNPRWGAYQPGIGPHTEVQTVALVWLSFGASILRCMVLRRLAFRTQTACGKSATFSFPQAVADRGRLR